MRPRVEFTTCHEEHVKYIVAQTVQSDDHKAFLMGFSSQIAASSLSLTGWYRGRCLGAAGLIDIWDGRAYAWALFAAHAAKHMLAITRHARFVLDRHPARRIEAVVRSDFPEGRTWMTMLGFTCDTPTAMRRYFPDGADGLLFSRVNDKWQDL